MKKRIIWFIGTLIFTASTFYLGLTLWNQYQYRQAMAENENIKEIFYQEQQEQVEIPPPASEDIDTEIENMEMLIRDEYSTLLEINEDTVGWIHIEGTVIDYPVVQGSDNDYYLRRAYTGSYLHSGTIFLDFRNDYLQDNNLIIYGHTITKNNMFADLNNYIDPDTGEDFFWRHNNIEFNNLFFDENYDVFSAYVVNLDEEDYYLFPRYEGEAWQSYIEEIRERSTVKSELVLSEDDQILTLVTCFPDLPDARTIIHAKRREMN